MFLGLEAKCWVSAAEMVLLVVLAVLAFLAWIKFSTWCASKVDENFEVPDWVVLSIAFSMAFAPILFGLLWLLASAMCVGGR